MNEQEEREYNKAQRFVSYERRRMDKLRDKEIADLRAEVRGLDAKVDALNIKLAWITGIMAVVIFLANIIGPVIAARYFGACYRASTSRGTRRSRSR